MTTKNMGLPSPETVTRRVLSNGMVALVRENFASPSVVVDGYLGVGSWHETPEQAGLASFTAAMLRRGTMLHTFDELNEILEGVGASVGVGSGYHATSFSGKSLREDFDLLLSVLTEVVQQPAFPEDQLEVLRGQSLTSLRERQNSTGSMASLAFRGLLYPGKHPYGRAQSGYIETVSGFTREAVQRFYDEHFGVEHSVIVVVGAIETEAAMSKLEASFGQWHPQGHGHKETQVPIPASPEETVREAVYIPGKVQADLFLGCQGIARNAPDYYAAVVANNIFGGFGIGGRLADSVRERQGMAYTARGYLEAGLGAGPWAAYAGINPTNLDRAIASMLEEMRKMREEPVEQEELDNSQALLTGSLPLRLETNSGLADTLLDMEWYGLGLDYLQRYPSLINAVTREDVQQVFRTHLDPARVAIGISGPPPV